MFTGIVSGLGSLRELRAIGDGRDMRLVIVAPEGFLQGGTPAVIGASIACSGCCLTATEVGEDWFAVEVSTETLSRTMLGDWRVGTKINLERSLRLGDELGGHMVAGHVDGVARVQSVEREAGSLRLVIELPAGLHRFVAEKGSVAIDGVSLTVNEVAGRRFGVNVIPHTAAATTLGLRTPGEAVHIEIDTLARYVARLAETTEPI